MHRKVCRPMRRLGNGFESLEPRLQMAATLLPKFVESTITADLNTPTAMTIAPDGRIFVAQKEGAVRVVQNNNLLPAPLLTVDTNSLGERGLLGIALDPNFATNQFVYVYYTTASSPIHNRVSRFTANGNAIVPGSENVLLDLETLSATNHNGGAIHFGSDGKLYIGVGENAVPSNSQSLSNRLGKLLRINPDGSIPNDNPFVGVSGASPEIWAFGLRNPFRFAVQPGSGMIYINDVGGSAFEEINLGVAGANYGWPNTEGETNDPAYNTPLLAYAHNSGALQGSSITGGAFYNPTVAQFPPAMVGDYFFSDFVAGFIYRYDAAADKAFKFATNAGNPVDLVVRDSGDLLYLDIFAGELRAIRYTNQSPVLNLGSTVAYTENAAPIFVSPHAGLSDADNPQFSAAPLSIALISNVQSTDRLRIIPGDGLTISGTQIRLSGVTFATILPQTTARALQISVQDGATPAQVRTLLRRVAFDNSSDNPSTAPRTLQVRLRDGDGATVTATKLIRVIAVNDSPVLAGFSGNINYQRSAPAVRLASAATLRDVDNPNFAGGTLSVSITAGGSAQNRLLFVGSVFTVDSAHRLYHNGLQIGTVNADGGNGTTPLLFQFNGNATAPRLQQLIRAVRFRTQGATNAGDCSIEFAFNDGKQGNANQSIVVSVT